MAETGSRVVSVRALASAVISHPFLGVFGVVASYIFYVRFFTPLRKIPGPFLGSLTRLWKVATILTARQEVKMMELHRKYGKQCKKSRTSGYARNDVHAYFQVLWFESGPLKSASPTLRR